ncbi:MAG: transcription antitermination factor NusB, partial [Victivallaceae bacterium]|nr:transcription antitermination factor NusB [Victivallaceae bacterium]
MDKERSRTSGQILQTALEALNFCTSGKGSLDDYLDKRVMPELRPPVASMLFAYYRSKNLIDHAVASQCPRKPQGRYRRLLGLVLAQCFFQSGIRPESAVNIAVDFARRKYGRSAAGFINGVLRSILSVSANAYL